MNFSKPIFIGGPETYFNSELFLKKYGVNYKNAGDVFRKHADEVEKIISFMKSL